VKRVEAYYAALLAQTTNPFGGLFDTVARMVTVDAFNLLHGCYLVGGVLLTKLGHLLHRRFTAKGTPDA
jgi:hypothetical protein